MVGSRHERVSELFLEACDLPEGERAGFLSAACGGDAELRREVEELLERDGASTPLDPSASGGPWAARALAELEGRGEVAGTDVPERVGPYEILGVLGEGGMGTVYRARQQRPERDVALKVVRAGLVREETLKRFEAEAALLGRLRHPGIAQIFEAGVAETAQGARPYFAMELVEGLSLSAWLRKHRPPTAARLELVARIADAVAHAHQRGVAHRDLKPSNILVDGEGRPHVVDFGVARAIGESEELAEERSRLTQTGQLVGTLAYMSPEQVSGDPDSVDTRSDVYALGVILYEALSGRRPIDVDGVSLVEAARRIEGREPALLGSLDRSLRGDVEIVVAKALEKDRERRYDSVAALAADLRRVLTSRPIEARPPSTVYQLGKLARRHRALVAGGVIALLALLVGFGVALVQARRATAAAELAAREAERAGDEARRAQEALAESDAVVTFLGDLLQSVHPDQLGRDVLVEDVLERAGERVGEEFAARPGVQGRIADAIGASWITLGEHGRARGMLELASERFLERYGAQDARTIRARGRLGLAYSYLSLHDEALEAYTLAAQDAERAFGDQSIETLDLRAQLAGVLLNQAKADEAEPLLVGVVEAGARVAPDDARHLEHLQILATARRELGQFQEALELTDEAYRRAVQVLGADHWKTLQMANWLGLELHSNVRFQEAIDVLEPTVERMTEVFGPLHPETLSASQHLALAYLEIPRFDEARELLVSSAERNEEVHGPDNPNTLLAKRYLLQLMLRMHQDEEGLALAQDLAERYERAQGADHPATIEALAQVGSLHRRVGQVDEAEAVLGEAVERAERVLPPADMTRLQATVGMAVLLRGQGRAGEALEVLDGALAAGDEAVGQVAYTFWHTMGVRGAILADLGRLEEGTRQLGEAVEGMARTVGPDSSVTLDLQLTLGGLLVRAGEFDRAIESLVDARERALDVVGPETHLAMRLSERLSEALAAAGDGDSALQVVEEHLALLDDGPPGRDARGLSLLQRLAALCVELGRTDDAAGYRARIERARSGQGE